MSDSTELVRGARMVKLPVLPDKRGNLTFVEGGNHLPWQIARVYYLYDVPGGEWRAGHAHHELQQLMVAASGSFEVHLDDGENQAVVTLRRPYVGLLMSNLTWREIHEFSSGSVCLVMASLPYDERDYIRDKDDFEVYAERAKAAREAEALAAVEQLKGNAGSAS